MGKYDMCMKKFLQNKEHFADLFNGCCFQGKQIILPEDLREAAENYVVSDALSTVSPESMTKQNRFATFHSDLKPLFQAMNCRNDKEKMAELMKDEIYAHLNEDTWDAIAVMTDNAAMLQKKNLYKTENQEKEEFNMCQALEALMEDQRNEGNLEKTKIVVRNMIARGYKTENICTIADCDSSIVENIRERMS